MNEMTLQRAKELLNAARQLLQKADDSPYVLDIMGETAFYDGTDCDGACLLEDIKEELGAEWHV